MKKIKIEIPKGHKATFDEKKGEITFAEIPTNPRERFNTWEDILEHHKMSQQVFDNWCKGLREHEIGERETEMIAAAYNGRQLDDPLPEYGDNTGPKGHPIFKMPTASGSRFAFVVGDIWHSRSNVGARQVFFGPEWLDNLRDAAKKFESSYEKARTK